jgi:anti-sigma regulatory factor (Ser/Thr protein kinase)
MLSRSEGGDLATDPPRGIWLPASRWRRVFPGEARELMAMRQFLAALLPECPARDDVMSVATELASNALRHTASGRGGRFAAEIVWHASVLHVAVSDDGAPSGPRIVDDPLQENGRGLVLVRGLSQGFGSCGDHHGRLVWADVPWTDPDGTAFDRGSTIYDSRFAGAPVWFGRPISPWGLACCERLPTARFPVACDA